MVYDQGFNIGFASELNLEVVVRCVFCEWCPVLRVLLRAFGLNDRRWFSRFTLPDRIEILGDVRGKVLTGVLLER